MTPQSARRLVCSLLLNAAAFATSVAAQGTSAAAVAGVVRSEAGAPLAGAAITLHNLGTGSERRTGTSGSGRFTFENVAPGGPYELSVAAIGYTPGRTPAFVLELGDRAERIVVLEAAEAAALEEVEVRATSHVEGGPSYRIPSDAVRSLPILDRNFTSLFATIPQAVGRNLNVVGGQHPGLNAVQIDGGVAGDVYGVGRLPGSLAGAKPLSLDAIDQLQILISPFDVRQGGFSGGLINAVTRSGSNRWEVSAFTAQQWDALVGEDPLGLPPSEFRRAQYGLTVGGPIVRDRLHVFGLAEAQHSTAPARGPRVGEPATGIGAATAARAARAFVDRYGFDAGDASVPVLEQPNRTFFAKATWQAGGNHILDLSHNWVSAHADGFNREVRNQPNRDGWQLSRSGDRQRAEVHTSRARMVSSWGDWSNEVIASHQLIDESSAANLEVPLFLVQGDVAGNYLAGGSTVAAQGTILDQRLLELTDNLTLTRGDHEVTAGGRAATMHFIDNLLVNAWGVWTFDSVGALEAREPGRFERNLPLRPGGPRADFHATELAVYAQDRWQIGPRFAITGGLRLDVPFIDHPPTNAALAASDSLGNLDTAVFPSGHAVLSPRLGLVWQPDTAGRTTLRAGAGGFAGRPPYVWLGGAFSNTGADQATLVCDATDGVPPPTTDLGALPDRCTVNDRPATLAATVVSVAPDFRNPQTIKLFAGLDRELGRGFSVSLDLIRTETRNPVYLSDLNLRPPETSAEGRPMYGAVTATGAALVRRRDSRFRQVFQYDNRGDAHATALSLTIARRWSGGGLLQLGYQYSATRDVFTVNRISAPLTYRTAPLDGPVTRRRLTRSGYDVPHNFTAAGTVPLAFGLTGSLLATVQSGRPYAYVVSGDANADGVMGNDLLYVPRGPEDISLIGDWAALDRFIGGEDCLRRARGRIMPRNSCRNPAFMTVDVRLARETAVRGRHRLELALDVFNLPNLLDGDWGLVRETSAGEGRSGLLSVAGWDDAANRPVYRLAPSLPERRVALPDASRWRAQLAGRYRY